jgi:hypothetical protein
MRKLMVAAFLLFACARAMAQAPDCKLAPNWVQQGAAREYVADTLFEYMDGNAEGYLIYRLVKMNGVTCKNGEDTILVDVYEMADAESAYGIFCANRDARQPITSIGMGGQVTNRRALFAKDKYYVEFAANPIKDHSANLQAFAVAFEKRISGRSTPPDAIAWFPKERLTPNSVRLIPESVLGIRLLKRGYVGVYEFGKAFLIPEETPESAALVMGKLKDRIGQTTAVLIGDEGFTGTDKYLDGLTVFRKGRYIGGYANLKGGYDASAEAKALAAAIR